VTAGADAAPTAAWPLGAATGVGSLPGTDAREAARLVAGELPAFPHLPELPERGAGADLTGRSAALLAGLFVDLQPAGWRFVDRPGLDHRRALDLLDRDLDALEEATQGWTGLLKLQAAGPVTLAATIELPRGGRALGDPGAVRDLTASLADGLVAHAADVARRVPGASIVVQLDEPALSPVLAGAVPTASGFGRYNALDPATARDRISAVVAPLATAGVLVGAHCCARRPPLGLLREAGATFLSFDATLALDEDAVGEAVEAGTRLMAGLVPSTDAVLSDLAATVDPVRSLWRRLGFAAERLAEVVVVSPTCGLAGASPDYARTALSRCVEAGRVLREEPE
jgi:methionine synthase II (cobalamin-independent)